MRPHPLLTHLIEAVDGRFPPVDGGFELMSPDAAGFWAIVEFTGHACILSETSREALARLGVDGYGGASHPDVQRHLAGPSGWIGCHDVVLARRVPPDLASPPLPLRTDLEAHPRVERARQHRRGVRVHADDTGLVVVGEGLAGRTEIAVELFEPARGGTGLGRLLIWGGLATLAPASIVFAQVSPGNAASLRAFLACGFEPVCSEILIDPGRRLTR